MTAGIVDVCSLVLTSAFFIGVILGTALIAQKCQALIDATKASLEERGWIVDGARSSSSSSSREGGKDGKAPVGSVVVVKTGKKKMDHERYLDATQRGVMKAWNASTFGSPSSQTRASQTTANASAVPAGGPGPGPSSSSSSFGGAISSTFTHFRSQLFLPSLAAPASAPPPPPPPPPQPGQLRVESAISSGQGQGVGASGGSTRSNGRGAGGVTSDGDPGGPGTASTGTRDSLYDMADRLSAWPSEKVEKVKRLRDQFLKV